MSEKNEKNFAISFARLIAMIFIVICHFCQFYGNEFAWWFNVGVQIFFCISGFLYGNKEIHSSTDFIAKNFKKILIPYFCFLIPVIIIYSLFARDSIGLLTIANAVLCSGTIDGIGHLWFISYILFCYLITPYLYEIAKKLKEYKRTVYLVFFCVVVILGQIIFYAYDSYFTFSRIFCYITGYFLAVVFKECGIKYFKKLSLIIIMGSILFNMVRIYLKYFAKRSFYGFSFFEQYAHALLGISLFLLVYLYCSNIKNNFVFKQSDKYSYYIYIVHQLFILSPFKLMNVTSIKYLNWFLAIVAIFVSAFILKVISDKVIILLDRINDSLKTVLKNN